MIDWSRCPEVESVADRCHGAPVVKGTRVTVQGILDNAEARCRAGGDRPRHFPKRDG
jgi:uncharacterized protein (DUF433 family)